MKETTLYICEICNTKYASKKEAKNCESAHIKPKKPIKMGFHPYMAGKGSFKFVAADQYPDWIDFEMQDGSTATYYRGRSID